MPELCLCLLCPANLEERILDLLLMRPDLALFTSTRTAVHGTGFGELTANDQVLGRALATEIQVLVRGADKDALLEAVRLEFSGAGLRYWITPVTQAGDIA